MRIEEYTGDRSEIAWLLRLAEDSERLLAGYLDTGRVWVARDGDEIVGQLLAAPHGENTWEIVNLAIAESHRGRGLGRDLIDRAVTEARAAGARRVEVATATADIGNLRFYQRCGFRMTRIVRDAFGPDTGYPLNLDVDGIPLRDQVWFDRDL
ncbi:N-acetyltransferase [Nocardia panacis]|uniref:N-acetyltransferase n=1 Tax=Nocardia panacis TaxID=2340916 RepID=A0A3A4KHM4_9NOCA|nr:N-acetyltransferase [Nocardia panacis]